MDNWQTFAALAAVLIAGLAFFDRRREQSISRDEYKEAKEGLRRDITRIEERLTIIEQTRPTTGELEAKLKAPSG